MLYEYAVDPQVIGSNPYVFHRVIEKFGFHRGRLISRFPKRWCREVYRAAENLPDMDKKRIAEALKQAKNDKMVRLGRSYCDGLGGWLDNALAQHSISPFHAIIAARNVEEREAVLVAADIDEYHPLMVAPRSWEVPRIGSELANAMRLMLRAANYVVFVDPFFCFSKSKYRETLSACMDVIHSQDRKEVRCEIHCCDHKLTPSSDHIERSARAWGRDFLPKGMTLALYTWKEQDEGEDFHARYMLTNVGGINVEAGFSAEGAHQNVLLNLLDRKLASTMLRRFERGSTVYDLVGPNLRIASDGTVEKL